MPPYPRPQRRRDSGSSPCPSPSLLAHAGDGALNALPSPLQGTGSSASACYRGWAPPHPHAAGDVLLRSSARSSRSPYLLTSRKDVSSSVFIKPLLLIDFVQKNLKIDVSNRKLTKPEYAKLLRAVRGVRIEVTHRGDEHHKHKISGLSVKPTKELSFKSPTGATKTVIGAESGATATAS